MLRLIFAAALFLAPWPAAAAPAAALAPLLAAEDPLPKGALIVDLRPAKAFAEGHIPGAINAPYAAWRGPAANPGRLPTEAALETLLTELGLTPATPVVLIHAGQGVSDFGAAARVYWTLKSAGFTSLAILNGGFAAWQDEGRTPARGASAPMPAPAPVDILWSDAWTMPIEDVAAVVRGDSAAVLLDARPRAFFEGTAKHPAAVSAGTLPGAVNLLHAAWFGAETAHLAPDPDKLAEIRALAAAAGGAPLVSFCNTGHWAATNWFVASELAGIADVRLFPESMVGWTLAGFAAVAAGN